MNQEQLVKVIDFWQKVASEDHLFPRKLAEDMDVTSEEVIDIVGPRRSGKSSVLQLLIQKLPKNKAWLYINFEDPFFTEHNTPQIIEEIVEVYETYFHAPARHLFFDEIQTISRWETAVRKLRDSGRYKIYITGSSSKLLSSELATVLSGRHRTHQLLPLSFVEYLTFTGRKIPNHTDVITKNTELIRSFKKYLELGGFPQIVLSKDLALLKQYFNDIIERDIVNRYDIRDREALKKMGVWLMTNAAKPVSVKALGELYDLSPTITSRYLSYFKEAFLVMEIPQFSYSLKTQHKAMKKLYAIDTGLANAVSFRFSEDKGRMLEHAVLLELLRRGEEVFYYKEQLYEIDFVVKSAHGVIELIQVAWDIEDKETKERELKALILAAKKFNVANATLLTFDAEAMLARDGVKIRVLPVYRWVLKK